MINPKGVIASEWFLLALSFLLVNARIFLHFHMGQKTHIVSDSMLILAILAALGLVICDTLTYRLGAMDSFTGNTATIMKIRFASNYFFDVGLYFPKFSMLAFYAIIVPRTTPTLRKALYGAIVFAILSSLTTLFADTFWCGSRPANNWSPDMECQAYTSMSLVKLNWALNFTSEVLIFLLPFPLIRGLNLRLKRERAGLLFVFMLGAITIIVSLARFIAMLIVANDISIYVLATAEFTIPIIILSMVSLRPLLSRIYSIASNSQHNSPFSASKDKTTRARASKADFSTGIWKKRPANLGEMSDSEVELTMQEPGKTHRVEEISITSEPGSS
ncbi:hypothetical protein yc1106_06479 [Curvularia clavata]|uniref:Rhodopsin domain-containing protein n=1 Tax=Curvularia clavata TaxID=95742 RepID=A0A9Q8ZCI0_CURCL|nr:hypothetical protein yc1106_06479 [Curvularia clavata]